jgi:hypothetical protein
VHQAKKNKIQHHNATKAKEQSKNNIQKMRKELIEN